MYVPIQFIDETLVHPQLNYSEMLPSDALKPYVACYWRLTSQSRLEEVILHRVIPDGCVDILFDLTSGETHFAGIMNQVDMIPLIGDVHLLGIRFLPVSIPFLLKGDAAFLVNHMLDVVDIFGNKSLFNDYIITPEQSWNQQVKRIEEELMIIFKHHVLDPRFNGMLSVILERGGIVTRAELAEYFTTSERQIARIFKSFIGVSTKEYASIIQFQSVLRLLKQSQSPVNWSDLSLQGGYYDQSHFIHAFKKHYGITPGHLITKPCPIFPIQ
ncbi:helix-turn-helix domain-containing protein [Paenibacillus terrigena]|uniref:helix-turn-helix domain-containing protein n=1 Tax=Paenibacillus terrigena TaxID=369333 RepID=UPI00036F0184|nr:helix-turn-helix transcriptional regulator [Paenibacillus terrigena]